MGLSILASAALKAVYLNWKQKVFISELECPHGELWQNKCTILTI